MGSYAIFQAKGFGGGGDKGDGFERYVRGG